MRHQTSNVSPIAAGHGPVGGVGPGCHQVLPGSSCGGGDGGGGWVGSIGSAPIGEGVSRFSSRSICGRKRNISTPPHGKAVRASPDRVIDRRSRNRSDTNRAKRRESALAASQRPSRNSEWRWGANEDAGGAFAAQIQPSHCPAHHRQNNEIIEIPTMGVKRFRSRFARIYLGGQKRSSCVNLTVRGPSLWWAVVATRGRGGQMRLSIRETLLGPSIRQRGEHFSQLAALLVTARQRASASTPLACRPTTPAARTAPRPATHRDPRRRRTIPVDPSRGRPKPPASRVPVL